MRIFTAILRHSNREGWFGSSTDCAYSETASKLPKIHVSPLLSAAEEKQFVPHASARSNSTRHKSLLLFIETEQARLLSVAGPSFPNGDIENLRLQAISHIKQLLSSENGGNACESARHVKCQRFNSSLLLPVSPAVTSEKPEPECNTCLVACIVSSADSLP